MLIPDAVKVLMETAIANGTLVLAKPIPSWAAEPRVVLLCAAISEALAQGRNSSDEKERQCWAKVEAAFSIFIEGGLMHENRLKQLREYKFEHWEFRCVKPKPSIRVFGRFVWPDVFVATHAMPRTLLGGMNSPEFEHEKLVCEEHWKAAGLEGYLFTDAPEFRYEKYITENARRRLEI